MNVIDWLLEGDVVIQQLTTKYLLNRPFDHQNGGFVARYLALYHTAEQRWGRGVYVGKWVSSTYTLLELKYMEIHPEHPTYQQAVRKVLNELWQNQGRRTATRRQDICMSAMVLSLVCYGKIQDERLNGIVDYLLSHQMKDGGWNCDWDSPIRPSIVGSVHTTLSVLEAFADYGRNGYTYRLAEIKQQMMAGQEFLLQRELFKSMKTGEPIHPDMIQFHYPTRWKYDCFRALEYFVHIGYAYDDRMKAALTFVKKELHKGYVTKGKQYSGSIHFPLETGQKGRFNTYRALLILKHYDVEAYCIIVNRPEIGK